MRNGRFVEAISEAYRIPLIDYGRDGDGLLLAVGSGMMMAAMDLLPRMRWCVDLGGGQRFDGPNRNRLAEWLAWMNREADVVAVAAWFSVTDPRAIREALAVVTPGRLAVYSNIDLCTGPRCGGLDTLAKVVASIDPRADSGTSKNPSAPRHGTGLSSGLGFAILQSQGPTANGSVSAADISTQPTTSTTPSTEPNAS